jgi:hypothetical protein
MNPFNPYDYVSMNGDGIMRGVTLALPSEHVHGLLPHGLTLGAQSVTPPGTHPVIVLFNEIVREHTSIPTLLPSLSYREHSLGVPYSYLTGGSLVTSGFGNAGPFYFQPRLHVDDFLAALGGILYWGFSKLMASFTVTEDTYTVISNRGTNVTSLSLEPSGEFRPIAEMPKFEPIRTMHDQPLISMLPLTMGPFFVCSNFDKDWGNGMIRPLQTVTRVDEAYVPGLDIGRFPEAGKAPGIDESVLGSYEMRLPFRLSMPYPPYAAGFFERRD